MGIRRVVAGHDENGKAVILSDGDAANVHQPTSTIESTLLWVTDSAPASNEGTTDTADQEIGIPPPPMAQFSGWSNLPRRAKTGRPRNLNIWPRSAQSSMMTPAIPACI